MPEGHTLHRLERDMQELVGSAVTAASPQGRVQASLISGATVAAVQAYGKHLFVELANGLHVHVHLGMKGKWLRFSPVTGEAMRQVRLRLSTPQVAWDLIAPSKCELLNLPDRESLIATLGPDPLRADAVQSEAWRRLVATPVSVGAAMMDQSVIAGVGNVFRAEALHACGIAPTRPSSNLSSDDFELLWQELQRMMRKGVEDGRIVTVPSDDPSKIEEDQARRVYKQESCYDCGTPIDVMELKGRTSYSCPTCQPD